MYIYTNTCIHTSTILKEVLFQSQETLPSNLRFGFDDFECTLKWY